MANYKKLEMKCPNCKKEYEKEYPSFIRVPEDNDLKNTILSGSLFKHECPSCHHIDFSAFTLTYVDDESKTILIGNFYANALITKMEMKEDYPDYKFYIIEEPTIIVDAVNTLAHHHDPLVMEFIKYDGTKYFELRNDCLIYETRVDFSEDDSEIMLIFEVKDNDDLIEKKMPVPSKMYIEYYNKVERYKEGADLTVLSTHYVNKLYQLAKNLEIEGAKSITYEFLQVRDKYDNAQLAFVQSFNNGKFKVGDRVALTDHDRGGDHCTIHFHTVERIIHMTDIEFIVDINLLPVATYKVEDVEFETAMDSNAELNNGHLRDIILSNFKDNEYDTFFNSNLIVPMEVDMSALSLFDAVNIGSIPANSLKHKFKTVEIDCDKYFALYLDQSDIKDETVGLKVILDAKTALKVFFNVADHYDGIIINPDTDSKIFSIDKVFRLITNRIMTNHNLMKGFIDNASSEEITFIGEEKYNLIKMVYSTDIGLAAIREELKLTKDKADYMLSDGYGRIQKIIKSQELM